MRCIYAYMHCTSTLSCAPRVQCAPAAHDSATRFHQCPDRQTERPSRQSAPHRSPCKTQLSRRRQPSPPYPLPTLSFPMASPLAVAAPDSRAALPLDGCRRGPARAGHLQGRPPCRCAAPPYSLPMASLTMTSLAVATLAVATLAMATSGRRRSRRCSVGSMDISVGSGAGRRATVWRVFTQPGLREAPGIQAPGAWGASRAGGCIRMRQSGAVTVRARACDAGGGNGRVRTEAVAVRVRVGVGSGICTTLYSLPSAYAVLLLATGDHGQP
jgi:hypothetical protein